MAEKQRVNCVAVDESKWSEHAFEWYAENFHKQNDMLFILHVQSIPHISGFNLLGGVVALEEYHEKLRASIENTNKLTVKYESFCNRLNIKFKFVAVEQSSSVGQAVCDFLIANSANVIVLGQRRIGFAERLIFGSTSDYVLHHAEIPVITIPLTC